MSFLSAIALAMFSIAMVCLSCCAWCQAGGSSPARRLLFRRGVCLSLEEEFVPATAEEELGPGEDPSLETGDGVDLTGEFALGRSV